MTSSAAPYPTWRAAVLVGAGGFVGTGARFGLSLLFPMPDGVFPLTVFVVNLLGALTLGALVGAVGQRRELQLLLGTGLLGGFTTYSALATDTATLLQTGEWAVGLGYGLGTVLAGGVLSVVGLTLGAKLRTELQAKPPAQLRTELRTELLDEEQTDV